MTKDQVLTHKVKASEVSSADGSKFVGAVFLYMFIALAITFGISTIFGIVFQYAPTEDNMNAFVTALIISLILYIPTLIWVQIAAIKNGRSMGPALVVYSAIMGVFISCFSLVVDFSTMAIAFGTTCGAFGVMALIAWTSKKNISTLGVIGSGLLIGALLISLVNLILYFVYPALFSLVYIAIEGIIFIAIILITICDLNRVKKIAESGTGTKNQALLCALNLYVDFIYIFIRILRIIAAIRNR